MSSGPYFEIGFWNAWLFFLPYLVLTYGLSFLAVDRKAALFMSPDYTETERMSLSTSMILQIVLILYAVFLPLKLGTIWFYVGLAIYLLGLIFVLLAIVGFSRTPTDEPVTSGVYRISRNPIYLSFFLICVGTAMAAASLVVAVMAIMISGLQNYFLIPPEEQMCMEKFGARYADYIAETPRWIGLPGGSGQTKASP